jgi:hypothetical protein
MRLAAGCLLAVLGLSACGNSSAPSSFGSGGSSAGSGGMAGIASGGSSGQLNDPTLGGPCVDDDQCDDGFDCTSDRCDLALGRCRFAPMNDRCADGVYCNGIEQCVPGFGCRLGDPVACSDQSTCSIDRCIESTRSCENVLRDADGDGDPVWNCGGTDCDDNRAEVNGKATEVCDNRIDDDCDGETDEADCVAPAHDTCADALVVDASGNYELSLLAAREDFALSCVEPGSSRRDAVVALSVPNGAPLDIDVTASTSDFGLGLAFALSCSDATSELICAAGTLPAGASGRVARITAHSVPPGAYPLYVSGLFDGDVSLKVAFSEATDAPSNETCDTALELRPGEPALARLTGTLLDVSSACQGAVGDLLYRFELQEAADVVLSAVPLDANGTPTLSLRDERCTTKNTELDCRAGTQPRLYERALPPGVYYVAVGATGPSDVELRLTLSPPTEAPLDEGCASPPLLPSGSTRDLDFSKHVNSFSSECLPGAVDATYRLSLEQRSDVLLVERLSSGDSGAVSLLGADCNPKSSRACVSDDARALCTCSPFTGSICSNSAPVRARVYDVPAGEYSVVLESALGSPAQITAFTRPAQPSTLVALSDTCDDALVIPEAGGRFSGSTSNANPDYSASCDFGIGESAPDQLLKLHLSETRRVILDAGGSDYATIIAVRTGAECPGREVERACAPGCSARRSFLDLTLPEGDYYVQIDGYVGASGHWVLDVFMADP